MSNTPRPFRHSVAYVGTVTGFYIAAGAGVGMVMDSMVSDEIYEPYRIESAGIVDKDSFDTYVNDTHQLELTTKDLEGRDQTLVVRFGEACVNAVLPYTSGGLIGTEEDSVVSDLLVSPKEPRGDEPTQVRQAVHEVRTVKAGLKDAEAADYNQRQANIAKTEHRVTEGKSDDSLEAGMIIGGALLGGLALLSTVASERDYRRHVGRRFGLSLVRRRLKRK